jgi:L-fucose isomerase-like protein
MVRSGIHKMNQNTATATIASETVNRISAALESGAPHPNQAVGLPRQGALHAAVEEIIGPLPAFRTSRIAVLGCGVRAHFPWDLAKSNYHRAVELVSRACGDQAVEVISAAEPFEDPTALIQLLDRELADGLSGIILFHASYTAGEIGSHLGRWLLDHPMPLFSWSFPEARGGRLTANSLCCQNFLLGIFQRMEVPYAWMHGALDEAAVRPLQRFARSVSAREQFRHAKVLHVGGSRVSGFYDGEVDELAVMRRFGLRFDRIDLETAYQHGRAFSDRQLRSLRDALASDARCAQVDVPDEQILQTYRFGLSILDLAKQHGYVGCTVKSWPDLFACYGCAIDGSISMLNDYGFCAAEEGEMPGLISSLALQFVSGGAAVPTLMDLSSADPDRNRLGIWHCGACPTRWIKAGSAFSARKHSILENGDPASAVGLMVEFLLALGPVTVTRYQSPDAARAFTFTGESVECPLAFRGNYAEVVPSAGVQVGQVMAAILNHGLDHHWSLGFGHWQEELGQLNHWLRIAEVALPESIKLEGVSAR